MLITSPTRYFNKEKNRYVEYKWKKYIFDNELTELPIWFINIILKHTQTIINDINPTINPTINKSTQTETFDHFIEQNKKIQSYIFELDKMNFDHDQINEKNLCQIAYFLYNISKRCFIILEKINKKLNLNIDIVLIWKKLKQNKKGSDYNFAKLKKFLNSTQLLI